MADEVSADLARPWATAVRTASVSRLPDLEDRLDAALAETDLGVQRIPIWAGLVRVLQWAADPVRPRRARCGSTALAVMAYLQLPGADDAGRVGASRCRR